MPFAPAGAAPVVRFPPCKTHKACILRRYRNAASTGLCLQSQLVLRYFFASAKTQLDCKSLGQNLQLFFRFNYSLCCGTFVCDLANESGLSAKCKLAASKIYLLFSITACAAASFACGILNGEHDT